MRDIVWQRATVEGQPARPAFAPSTTARVIDQEATWRWGLLGGKSRMRLLVKTTDAEAEASFALMQPSEVGGAKSATLRGETIFGPRLIPIRPRARGERRSLRTRSLLHRSLLLRFFRADYRGVMGVARAPPVDARDAESPETRGGCVLYMRGEAAGAELGFAARAVASRAMKEALRGQVVRTLADVCFVSDALITDE
jgi:hypothetical protein